MATNEFDPQKTSSNETRRFDKQLQKDVKDYHLPENEWVHARNAINNSITGDLGRLGNEPANKLCIQVFQDRLNNTGPLTIIGMIHLESDKWAVFSTDDIDSEIGYFEGDICRYSRIVNDRCLNFNRANLITGQAREAFDCNYVIYWADGLNPDRYMPIGDIRMAPYPDNEPWPGVPYNCIETAYTAPANCSTGPVVSSDPSGACTTCIPTIPLTLNCNKIRLESLMRPLKLHIKQDAAGGNLLNGSYIACGAYTVNGQRVTDYFTPSNVVGLFNHDNPGGSVEIEIVDADTTYFDEFELVIVSIVQQQAVARRLGFYSTKQKRITYDVIDLQLPVVPIEQLPVSNVLYEKSDAMFNVNDYLLRVGPTSKFLFNYQPLANQIRTKWAVVEYPEGYYENGGVNTGYMRDEVYSFFIRWVYKTGDRSASFHIPGRPKIKGSEITNSGDDIPGSLTSTDAIEVGLECGNGLGSANNPYGIWEQQNTAYALTEAPPAGSLYPTVPYQTCDAGVVIEEGYMGYWESTERYPDNKPEIWNSSAHPWSCITPTNPLPYVNAASNSVYDLCGKQIRHHRFPDNDISQNASHFRDAAYPKAAASLGNINHIRVMGVKFENIRPPVDNDGNPIPNIFGYEILRGSRQGNRTVVAKGIINNMVKYDPKTGSDIQGLFQNYPFNDLQGDRFLSKTQTRTNLVGNVGNETYFNPDDYSKKLFSFHGPDTNFKNPYLSAVELKVYQNFSGTAKMKYQFPSKQPKQIFIRDLGAILAGIGGIGLAILATKGKKKKIADTGLTAENLSNFAFAGPAGAGFSPNPVYLASIATAVAATAAFQAAYSVNQNAGLLSIGEALGGLMDSTAASSLGIALSALLAGSVGTSVYGKTYSPQIEIEYGANDYISFALNTIVTSIAGGYPTFVYYLAEGADQIWRTLELASKPQYHVLQSLAHCYYGSWTTRAAGQRRRLIRNQAYIDNQIIDFGTQYRVNNLYRNRYVLLELSSGNCTTIPNSLTADLNPPTVVDDTRMHSRLCDLPGADTAKYRNPEIQWTKPSSTYYAALKSRIRNQYGQINNIIQIPISTTQEICPPTNGGLRGGFRIQEGFQLPEQYYGREAGDGLRLPLLCPDNLIQNPQFGNGISTPSFANWISQTPGFWIASTVGGTTFAKSGQTPLFGPNNLSTTLYQTLPAPIAALAPITMSFLVKTLSPGYKVKVYIGNTFSPLFTVLAPGNYSTPAAPPTLAPASGPPGNDTVRFVIEPPVQPATIEANFNINIETPGSGGSIQVCNTRTVGPGTVPNTPLYLWGSASFSNVVNNTSNVVTSSSLGWTYENYVNGVVNQFLPGSVYNNIYSYISGITCTTRIRWNMDITHVKTIGALGPCDKNFRIMLMRIQQADPPGFPGRVMATLYDRGVQIGGSPVTPYFSIPSYWMNGNYVPANNSIPLTTGSNPAGAITSSTVTTVNNIIGSVTITNPAATDRFYILIDANGTKVQVSGKLFVDLCSNLDPVEITDICLNDISGGSQGVGCADPYAINYDPSVVNPGPDSCIYAGCNDPLASNYNSLYTYGCNSNGTPILPSGVSNNSSFPCSPCVYITPPSTGGVVSVGTGYGYCNWPCLPESVVATAPVSYRSPVLFGGDVYIGRYTEKNTFFYFFDWLYGQPDLFEWDYFKYRMIPYPTYWFHAEGFSMLESVMSVWNTLTNPGNWNAAGFNGIVNPSDYYVLDRPNAQLSLAIKRGYMYLFNSGVRDFFVESEYNVDYRDFGNATEERHYMPYGKYPYSGLSDIFDAGIIKRGNYYKYDDSLSIARIWYSYVGWGQVYPSYYNPGVAETCYQYRPDRIIYSLPVQKASVRDNWRIYLTNNYKDFLSRVIAVKQINKSGALILFESDSPVMFQGTDQLQTDLGTKLTIGDGGLFSQPMQNIMNAERAFEYASSQNRLSIINTPVGAYWISQNQGKIFSLASSISELSMTNIKWWLAQFLPYQLTKYFPNYKLKDNPVVGIGCQTVYDNTNNLVYFTKKDYKPVLDNQGNPLVSYDPDTNEFYINVGGRQVKQFSDPNYFEPASWTISFDVKTNGWISFHDWHPDLAYSDKNTFMTTKVNGIWQHNRRCDLYANYYGIPYPFEVEYMVNTAQTVNTLRSIEYQLEVYQYKVDNCYDRFHVLDYNFDEAVIYNTEQCSGLLKLNVTPKNNPTEIVAYPQVTPVAVGTSGQIDILYSKEENKYRFNQFWDATFDRGEFPYTNPASVGPYPPVPSIALTGGDWANSGLGNWRERNIWDTQPNGYIRTLNNNNINYSKAQLERKRFRHYTTSVLLRRKRGDSRKILVSLVNNKNLYSPR